jgi:hypothetical protein
MKIRLHVALLCTVFLLSANPILAINNNIETTLPEADGPYSQFIPYGFYNANTGLAVAAVFLGKGHLQPQMTTVGNAFVGSRGSYTIFLSNLDIKLPFSERLFVDQVAYYSDWDEIDSYQNGNPAFPNERAGSNGSDADNYLEAEGDDLFVFFNFKYLLPIGHGREAPPHNFNLTEGMLNPGSEAGGQGWNPLASGRTILEFRPFYRQQNFDDSDTEQSLENETAGAKVSLMYDNTDWYNNPSTGTRQSLTWARDWGVLDDSSSWTAIQGRHSQFLDLGSSKAASQRVLAWDVWASHSPTWNDRETVDGERVFSRPPLFEGSTLGGLERQRAYPSNRYWDRSAINYTLEYRYIPRWNPMPDIPYINKLFIPWWQWVAFAELGRVHDQFDLKELHQNMKWTVGGGVRALVHGLVIRVDIGASEEGGEVQMFFTQPF